MSRKNIFLGLTAAALVASLAACGGDDDSGSTGGGGAMAPASEVERFAVPRILTED